MGILKALFYILLCVCFMPYLYGIDSGETNVKKRIHVDDDKRSKYKVNNFTTINLNSNKKGQKRRNQKKRYKNLLKAMKINFAIYNPCVMK